jgi:hypothetical protein
MFQLVASLMIFGISAHEFEGLSEFFVPSMHHLAPVKKFDELRPQQERAHFHRIWETALEKHGVSGDFGTILRKMLETDRSFLMGVMNFLMTSCQLTTPSVSSGIAIFAGEVLLQMDVYTADEPLF